MPSLNDKFIEELKNKIDIVDFIGQYAHLQLKGGQYWACCPLPGHSERTPSFAVNKDAQFYHCFGCGKGGDVIKFAQEVESLDFMEAVTFLCNKYNIEMPVAEKDEKELKIKLSKKERLLALLKDTALFYVHNLKLPAAKPYLDYMEKRGLTKSVIIRFGLGASLDYNSLPAYLRKKGYTEAEMLDSGAVSKNASGYLYDCQAERLVIPMINNFGDVVAFSGRILEKTAGVGKYKNTRETSVFIKSRTLFNINNLKREKNGGGIPYVIVVEGHMDAVSVYNAGFKCVVASMGTALTIDQTKLLKRYSNNVIICYDGDAAGQKGMIRGLEILKGEGLNVKVVCLPDGYDPDDVIRKLGADEFKKLLDNALPLTDYKLYLVGKNYNIKTADGKRFYINDSLKVIKDCDSEAEREERLRALAKQTGITYESLYRDMENADNSKPETKQFAEAKEEASVSDRIVTAERFVLASYLFKRKCAKKEDLKRLTMKDDVDATIAKYVLSKLDNNEEVKITVLPEIVGEENIEKLNEVLLSGNGIFDTANEERYYKDCVALLVKTGVERELDELNKSYSIETNQEKRNEIAQLIKEKSSLLFRL